MRSKGVATYNQIDAHIKSSCAKMVAGACASPPLPVNLHASFLLFLPQGPCSVHRVAHLAAAGLPDLALLEWQSRQGLNCAYCVAAVSL